MRLEPRHIRAQAHDRDCNDVPVKVERLSRRPWCWKMDMRRVLQHQMCQNWHITSVMYHAALACTASLCATGPQQGHAGRRDVCAHSYGKHKGKH
jgi:hypothetical protein